MLRELTRLLDPAAVQNPESTHPDSDPDQPRDADRHHRRDMLTFEMYLAAWISREGMCDKPKPRKKKAKPAAG